MTELEHLLTLEDGVIKGSVYRIQETGELRFWLQVGAAYLEITEANIDAVLDMLHTLKAGSFIVADLIDNVEDIDDA